MKRTAMKRLIALALCFLMAVSMLMVGVGAAEEQQAATDLLSGALMELPGAEEIPALEELSPVEEAPTEETPVAEAPVEVTPAAEEAPEEEAPVAEETPVVDGSTASGTCGEGLTWDLTDGVLTISGTGAMAEFGYPNAVPWYSYNKSTVTSVVIGEGVTTISPYAFYYCSKITSVTIPEGVTSIGKSAFEYCGDLVTATIPSTVTTIGEGAFRYNYDLTGVTLPAGLTTLAKEAFRNCSSLTEITIPGGVETIGEDAFYNCSKITSVTISDGVKTIGESAFGSCSKLASVTIPKSVTTIEADAFVSCSSLTTVTYGGTEADWMAMDIAGNAALWTILGYTPSASGTTENGLSWTLEEGKLTITGTGAMKDYGSSGSSLAPWCVWKEFILSAEIGEGITSVGGCAFYGCLNMISVSIPAGVTSIGNYAFYGCKALTEAVIPQGVTTIGQYGFYNCSAMTTITIPTTVTEIGYYAFSSCSKLATVNYAGTEDQWYEITIGTGNDKLWNAMGLCPLVEGTCGESLTYLLKGGVLTISGTGAMTVFSSDYYQPWYNYRSYIASVVVEEGVTSVSDFAFRGTSALKSLSLPSTLTSIGKYAFYGCSGLTAVTIPASVTEMGENAFANCYAITSVTLPEGLTVLGEYAFSSCSGLTAVTIPGSIKTIGARAFSGCSKLTTVTIGEGVETIGNGAFSSCEKITGLTLPTTLKTIGDSAFYYLQKMTELVVPEGVTTIGAKAFYCWQNAETLTLPVSVTTIGEEAFYGVWNVDTMTYGGTTDQWYAMDIAAGNDTIWELMGLCPIASGTCGESITWTLKDNVLTLTGTGAMSDYSYSEYAPWYDLGGFITSVVIGEGITYLGTMAFYNTSVESLTIPSTVTTIAEGSVAYCYSLETVDLSGNDIYAMTVGGNNDYLWKALGQSPKASGTTEDGLSWTLENYILTVTGTGAMGDYEQYSDPQAPWRVYDDFVKELVIAEGITSIGEYAFCSLSSLTTVTIPATVTAIGEGAFQYDSALKTATFLGTADEWYAINDTMGSGNDYLVNAISFDARVRGVCGDNLIWILEEDSELGTVTLTIEGTGDMYDWYTDWTPWHNYKSSITDIVMPEGLTSIGINAFRAIYKITELDIPETVTRIEYYSVAECQYLPEVEIPESVEFIGEGAFGYNNKMEKVTVYSRDCEIYPQNNTFTSPDTAVIYGYLDSTAQTYAEDYGYKFVPLDYTGGVLSSGSCGENATWRVEDGVLYISGEGEVDDYNEEGLPPWYAYRDCITEMVVEEGITNIGGYTLYNVSAVSSVTIPSTVEAIGSYAFYDCIELKTVDLPENLKSVGAGAFRNCVRLQTIDLPEGCTTVGAYAFYNCYRMYSLELGGAAEIGDYAFYNCYNIPSVALPDGLKTIGAHAFRDCKGLAKITLPASLESIGSCAFYAPTMTVVIENEDLRQFIEEVGYDISSEEEWWAICMEYAEWKGLSDTEREELLNNPPEMVVGTDLTQVCVSGTDCVFPADENALGVPGCTVIYGAAGSTAEDYADTYGYEFNRDVAWTDVTGNGVMTTADAAEIMKYAMNLDSVFGTADADTEALREKAANVNGDEVIDARDATQILRYANGLPSVLD